jgi:4-hydroxy-tetrahydrodipicolinate reductase
MNIALVGTGRMGQAVADLAPERGHEVVAQFSSERPLGDASPGALGDADVAIDFSLPTVALEHIRRYCTWQQPAVVGTTGWYGAIEDVRDWVDTHNAALLYAPNFSLGIAVLKRALEAVTPLVDAIPDFDAFVHELHHVHKMDSPSGTAEMLADVLVEGLARKSHMETETQHRRIDPEAVHVTSTRGGEAFGEHTVSLDSAFDRVELTHRAKGRRGFALGALRSAEWVVGRTGLYTLDDVLDDWLE